MSLLTQQKLRELTINYSEEKGVRYTFIAEKIQIHRATLCSFLKERRSLPTPVADKLFNFLILNN